MWKPESPTPPKSPPGMEGAAPPRKRNPGRRFGQVVKLRPECVDAYKACHARIWPEVAKQIKDCNMEDYSIWYDDKTGLLFGSFKYIGYDFAGDMQRMAENPRVRQWWKMTDGFQESLVDGATSSESGEPGWWRSMEEVFYQA
ncbi:L-rhamnose mutarotase [Tolypocladium paradoxum]|uniref:L-rhamnose mutarotase n=1 Tax=Tolypocladium paradoxum TaxID=94208 RepID=A0A2S4KQT4_9HYPO|nr:L-rhamnose mutarotase [Tolypocladium paradoxum]